MCLCYNIWYMAQYKVPQDVEADDKLLGPFTFRQFIYLLVAAGLIAIAVGLFQIHPLLVIIPIPPVLLLLALSLPLKKDQPMETYLAALVSFYLKPRKKLWNAGEPESTIHITAPKVKEEVRTRDISGEEATHRLSFLANIVDSEGRAINNINSNVMRDDLAAEANSVTDIFEDHGQFNNIDTMLQKDESSRHAEVMENMRKAIAAAEAPLSAPVATAAPASPAAPVAPAAPTTTAPLPTISRDFNIEPEQNTPADVLSNPARAAAMAATSEQPNFDSPVVVLPGSPIQENKISASEYAKESEKAKNTSADLKRQGIINLANNSDVSVSTLAKEAKRINRKEDDEVFISLH